MISFWIGARRCASLTSCSVVGTTSHLSDIALQNQLEATLEPSLCNYCFHERLNKILVLKDWVQAVKEVDEKLKEECKCSCDFLEEETALCNTKHPTFSSKSQGRNTSCYSVL